MQGSLATEVIEFRCRVLSDLASPPVELRAVMRQHPQGTDQPGPVVAEPGQGGGLLRAFERPRVLFLAVELIGELEQLVREPCPEVGRGRCQLAEVIHRVLSVFEALRVLSGGQLQGSQPR